MKKSNSRAAKTERTHHVRRKRCFAIQHFIVRFRDLVTQNGVYPLPLVDAMLISAILGSISTILRRPKGSFKFLLSLSSIDWQGGHCQLPLEDGFCLC